MDVTADNAPLVYSVAEAARELRIGRTLAYSLIARGHLPAVRVGRLLRIPRSSLAAWLERQGDAAREWAGPPTKSTSG